MAVIALVGNKGGAGKTTLCVNLAAALRTIGRVLVLDADPQQSALGWRMLAESQDVFDVESATEELSAKIAAALGTYDNIVLDCPPSVYSPGTRTALACADIALMPVQPSPFDLWATVQIEPELAQARTVNAGLRPYLVINQLEPRTKLSQQMRQALDELGLPAARTHIRRRMVYRTAILAGRTVQEMGRQGAAAAQEIDALTSEVLTP